MNDSILFSNAFPGQPYSEIFNITAEQVSIGFLEHVVLTTTVDVMGYNISFGSNNLTELREENNWTPEQERAWLTMPHPRRGDIKIQLTSPSGTTSTLLPYRDLDFVNNEGYEDWPFTSVQHWGEDPLGEWTLLVAYRSSFGKATVNGARLTLYGTEATPQAVLNMPAQCDAACKRNCSGVGPNQCDACRAKRVSSTLECVDECPKGTYLYKSHYCNSQDTHTTTATTTTTAATVTTKMIIIISVSTSAGVILVVFMTLLICVCCAAMIRRRGANQRQYVRLQFDDLQTTSRQK
jgi:subtilisin-like proprotein convertase family protein